MSMLTFVNRASFPGIKIIAPAAGRPVQLFFNPDLPRPCTVSTNAPFEGPGKQAFEVRFANKGSHNAVGFIADSSLDFYLTPTYITKSGAAYVSMGGAGIIYPEKVSQGSSYGVGDTVRCTIDFDERVVEFAVNGHSGVRAKWVHGAIAFPAISSAGGDVECEVTFN